MALTILCVSFTLLLLLGVPVAFSIGLSSLATILYEGLPLAVGFQQMISGMNPFSFLAIPFFIFAGEIMLGLIAGMIQSTMWMLPVAWILEVAWIGFSLFISALQAYVFVLLTNLYISHKIIAEH